MKEYLKRMKGGEAVPPLAAPFEVFLSFIGSLIALLLVGWLHSLSLDLAGAPLIMAPFGASAVLLFGAFRSPLAQPRNVIGGHAVSALIGITAHISLGAYPQIAVGVAVASAIAVMHLTKTLHPPGGATAFVTAASSESIQALGYWYVLTPCAIGSALMVLVAVLVNNIPKKNRYPLYWY